MNYLNGKPIERLEDCHLKAMAERLERNMSLYLREHPEEMEAFKKLEKQLLLKWGIENGENGGGREEAL